MKVKDEITRSLVIDKNTWNESMKYARANYNLSLSKVIDSLLAEWLIKEKRKGLINPNQMVLVD